MKHVRGDAYKALSKCKRSNVWFLIVLIREDFRRWLILVVFWKIKLLIVNKIDRVNLWIQKSMKTGKRQIFQ